jgi:hypothetical protein
MVKLNMELDDEEVEKLNIIRAKYGIKQLTEIVRLLISKEAEKIMQAQQASEST